MEAKGMEKLATLPPDIQAIVRSAQDHVRSFDFDRVSSERVETDDDGVVHVIDVVENITPAQRDMRNALVDGRLEWWRR